MSSGLAVERRFRIPNEEITWAGGCAWTGGYCFGTESGRLFFYLGDSDVLGPETNSVRTDDAINGVAFYDEFVGVSTRSEVNVYRRDPARRLELIANAPGGAHGILATPNGQFIAPAGSEGLYRLDMRGSGSRHAWNERAHGASLNFYSSTYLGNVGGTEVLACAGRADGLIRFQLDLTGDQTRTNTLAAPDVDVIDVCSLGSPRWPFAVAAFRLDGSMILVRDLLSDDQPETFQTGEIQGTPYAVRCAQGHLFILTSERVAVFLNLARRYLDGERSDQPIRFRQRRLHADDMFIKSEKELLVLTDDGVEIEEILKLGEQSSAIGTPGRPSLVHDWTEGAGVPKISTFPSSWASLPADSLAS